MSHPRTKADLPAAYKASMQAQSKAKFLREFLDTLAAYPLADTSAPATQLDRDAACVGKGRNPKANS